ncbi:MAG: hypothetical protein H7227_08050 [Actinobacteria bacterium]|nr:hypothetical protein [Actinomycetota bacterium]
MKIVRKGHPNEEDADVFYVERAEKSLVAHHRKSAGRRVAPYLIVAIVIALGTITFQKYLGDSPQDTRSIVLALQGKKVLDEMALRDLVVSQELTAYWIGPKENSKYALSSYPDGQIFVRYLPDGKGLADTSATYLVIATYPQKDAFVTTQIRANDLNAVGFTNLDGHAVFYSTTRPASVYVGLRDVDFQVEIFDPTAGRALIAARTAGLIRQIK